MLTVHFLRHLVENHHILIYFIIWAGLVVEGEFILISTGILFHLGALNIYVASIFILLGLFSKTFLGYYIGVIIQQKLRHIKIFNYIEKRVSSMMPNFKKKPFWSVFISKYIMGANNLVILFSGYHRVDFKKYIQAESLSNITWGPMLVCMGYFFSYTALHISHEVWRFSFIVLVLVVSFIVFDKIVGWLYEIFEELYYDHK